MSDGARNDKDQNPIWVWFGLRVPTAIRHSVNGVVIGRCAMIGGRTFLWMSIVGGFFAFEDPVIRVGLGLVFFAEIVISETRNLNRKH